MEREARFVYQEESTEVSPERYQISSERRLSSFMLVGTWDGWAISARACSNHN